MRRAGPPENTHPPRPTPFGPHRTHSCSPIRNGPITFRPPQYGKKLWALPKYFSDHDRTTVTWDVEPDSATNASADQIVTQTADAVRPGSIILLHVMYKGRGASRAAIPRIVSELSRDGYRFVTVSDLISRQ
jgi:peptidoglycan/xylan/chitin deacetylase (PgdA/CDA1 family)